MMNEWQIVVGNEVVGNVAAKSLQTAMIFVKYRYPGIDNIRLVKIWSVLTAAKNPV